ncbi:MAG: sigma 54-interacting transcriptional regulator, partial [Myxococcales bacterium]|nr:sigma 54-interacting transcriptional regulator [Myxococcales bacterium]
MGSSDSPPMKAWEASTDDGPRAPVGDRRAADGDEDHALVVVWSSSEPDRIGECARLRLEGPPVLLGRGPVRPDDGCARVRFFRERPFALSECPPLAGARISRQQLRLTPREDTVDFERLGACAVLHNGIARDRGTLRSGDTLSLRDELVVVLTRRAPLAVLPSAFPDDRSGPFGCADSFGIVGESASTWRIRQEIAFAAAVDAHVMVTGSSGVGKELVARAIQALSARASEVFIARSAVSFPPTLVDAELFGNMRNYPNPGMTERQGLVGAADRGTLFLDEIG